MSEASRPADEAGNRRTPPWLAPGHLRRDCEPHRGPLLTVLGLAALACGLGSVFVVVTAVIGLPLGVAVSRMASHDLNRMRWGQMDPEGRRAAVLAQLWGVLGVLCSLFCWVPLAAIYVLRNP